MVQTDIRRILPCLLKIICALFVLSGAGCVWYESSDRNPSELQYQYAAEKLGYFFIFRDDLPDDLYGFSSPELLFESLGDPYTRYWNREAAAQAYSQLTTTVQGGVGVYLDSCEIGYVLKRVFPGSPADSAGLEDGDTVVAVDGFNVAGLTPREFTSLVGGEVGSEVQFRVKRGDEFLSITVVRGTYLRPTVFVDSISPSTVKIVLTEFLDSTVERGGSKIEFTRALDSTTWAENTIVDLRNNGGGLVSQCIAIVSQLLEEGTPVIRFSYRHVDNTSGFAVTETDMYKAEGPGTHRQRRLYLLVNYYTASAAEIMTSCLMAREGVTVIGDVTYGKGCGQYLIDGRGGTLMKITSMTLSPADTLYPEYNLVGIIPDVRAEDEEDALDIALDMIDGGTGKRRAGAGTCRSVPEPAACDDLRMLVVGER